MLDDSLFVSGKIHERVIELPDGKKHVLHFREVPALEFRRLALAERSADEDVRVNCIARIIAASLCNPDGAPAITVEKAQTLKTVPMNAIFSAVLEVNGQGGQKKDLTPEAKTTSGTS